MNKGLEIYARAFFIVCLLLITFPQCTTFATEQESPVSFTYHKELTPGYTIDEYYPPLSEEPELSIHAVINVSNELSLSAEGNAHLSYPSSLVVKYSGNDNGGYGTMDYVIEFIVFIYYDLMGQYQGEEHISFIPSVDIDCHDAEYFDPFLLSSNPDRPLVLSDGFPWQTFFSMGITEDQLPIPDVSGSFSCLVRGEVTKKIYGDEIKVNGETISTEGGTKVFPVPATDEETFNAHWKGHFTSEGAYVFKPELHIEVPELGSFTLPDIEIVVPTSPTVPSVFELGPESSSFNLPNISVPESIEFPHTPVTIEVSKEIAIRNTGKYTLHVSDISTTSSAFSVSSSGGFSLQPAEQRTITVSFLPASEGSINGSLKVTSDDPDEPSKSIPLSGTGYVPMVHYTFDTDNEGWVFAGEVPSFDIPACTYTGAGLGLCPSFSTNCFSYWYSPDVQIENGNLYRARGQLESSVIDPDQTVQFRLRVNQKGSWQAWDRIVNSFKQQAPAYLEPKWYDVYFDPHVTGSDDDDVVLNFDIMSFSVDDDYSSWLYLDALIVDEVSITSTSIILDFTFDAGAEGWQYGGAVPPFDQPIISAPAGKLCLSPNGSTYCFAYLYSPDVAVDDAKLYRAHFEIGSSVTNADDAVQFRLRVNQKGSWQAWDRLVNSNMGQGPSSTGITPYNVIFQPNVAGGDDAYAVFSFDIMSFDARDDTNSWLYLDSLALQELTRSP